MLRISFRMESSTVRLRSANCVLVNEQAIGVSMEMHTDIIGDRMLTIDAIRKMSCEP